MLLEEATSKAWARGRVGNYFFAFRVLRVMER